MAIEVWTIQDLININNNLSGDYIQMADIDVSDYEDWHSIASYTYPEVFTGKYNGNGFKIIGNGLNPQDWTFAVFKKTENAVLENIIVKNMSLIYNSNGDIVENCHAKDSLIIFRTGWTGLNTAGNLITRAEQTTIKNCSAENITVENPPDATTRVTVGGLIGFGDGIKCYDCIVKDFSVLNQASSGGFAYGIYSYGSFDEPEIPSKLFNCTVENFTAIDSYSTGGFASDFYASNAYNCTVENFTATDVGVAGGFANQSGTSHFEKCFVSGTLEGSGDMSGFSRTLTRAIVRECFADINLKSSGNISGFSNSVPEADVEDCYFKGDIICTGSGKKIGGFSSFAPATSFRNCYSAANISAQDATIYGFIYSPGGDVVTNCYYNSDLTGITAGAGEPRTTEQMTYPYDENTYEGWDFDDIWGPDTLHKNEGYPFLRAFEIVIEPPISFKKPTIETYRVNCANPDIILKAYPPEQGEGTAHFKIDMYDEGKVLIDSVNTLSSPERFKYSKDKINWSDFPKEGLMIQDDIYIKATIYIGPRRGIWLKAGIGEGE